MFTDLAVKAASEYSVMVAHNQMAKLDLFSHTFTELAGRPGESIAVPVYDLSASADFVAGTNDYGTGSNEVGGMLVNLDKHLVKSVAITDKELAFTGINWVKDTAGALTERITRDINAYVFGLFNDTNCSLSAEISSYIGATPAKTSVAGLIALAEDNDIPSDRCVLALSPSYFAKVLALVDYNMIGTGDYIKTGVIQNIFGFKGVVMTSALPTGVNGVIIYDEAMGLAAKYLAPMTPDAYPQAWAATAEDGFTIGFRRFLDLNTGSNKFAVDALFGAKLLQADKCVLLK